MTQIRFPAHDEGALSLPPSLPGGGHPGGAGSRQGAARAVARQGARDAPPVPPDPRGGGRSVRSAGACANRPLRTFALVAGWLRWSQSSRSQAFLRACSTRSLRRGGGALRRAPCSRAPSAQRRRCFCQSQAGQRARRRLQPRGDLTGAALSQVHASGRPLPHSSRKT